MLRTLGEKDTEMGNRQSIRWAKSKNMAKSSRIYQISDLSSDVEQESEEVHEDAEILYVFCGEEWGQSTNRCNCIKCQTFGK
jgi:hypothetical protein